MYISMDNIVCKMAETGKKQDWTDLVFSLSLDSLFVIGWIVGWEFLKFRDVNYGIWGSLIVLTTGTYKILQWQDISHNRH